MAVVTRSVPKSFYRTSLNLFLANVSLPIVIVILIMSEIEMSTESMFISVRLSACLRSR